MRIQSIHFADDKPVSVTVTLQIDQAAYLARITGAQTGSSANEFMTGGDYANSSVFDCLAKWVFNAHWEDGVDGYLRGDAQ